MDIKKKKQIVLILSSILLIIAYVITNNTSFEFFGFCSPGDPACVNDFNYYGIIILYAAKPIFLVSLILLFVKDKVFELWQKFAVWYLPIAAILIWLIPEPGSGDFLAPSNIMFTEWFFWLYALISVVLIAYKSIGLKKSK